MRLVAVLASLAIVVAPATASAETERPKTVAAHTASLFDTLCLSHAPDIDATAKLAAEKGYTALTGDALKPYQPQVPAEILKAWKLLDRGARFTLVIAKSKPDAQFKASVPDFANSTNYACTLIPAAGAPEAETAAEIIRLLNRKADQTFEQGPLSVQMWSRKLDKMLVHAFHYSAKGGGATRLLSISVFVKD